jgi:hypothetical protein
MPRGQPDEAVIAPEVSPIDAPRKIIPRASEASIAPGLDRLADAGDAVYKKFEADSNTYVGNQLANLRLGMMQHLEDAKSQAQPGADGFTSGVLKTFDEQAKQYSQDGGMNPYVARAIQPGLSRMREQFGQMAIEYEAQAGIQYRAQSAKDTVDKLATIAASHPEQAQELTGQALSQINGSRLGPDVSLQTARYAQSAISKSAVIARINADPYATMTQLLKPETADVTIQGLRPDERETLLTHADAMLHQRVEDAQRLTSMQERQERQDASAGLERLLVKSQSPGGVSQADILKMAPLFRHDPAAMEAAIRLTEPREIKSDPHVVVDLSRKQAQGEDVFEEAASHVGRDLSKDDFQRYAAVSDKGLPNATQQGVQTINGLFKQGLFDKYDLGFNTRHMGALNDFYAWARQNPQASTAEAVNQANEISSSYNSKSALATDSYNLPRFAVGGRTAFDPLSTIAATSAAEQAGTISHQEAVKQMALIMQWKAAIDRVQKQ